MKSSALTSLSTVLIPIIRRVFKSAIVPLIFILAFCRIAAADEAKVPAGQRVFYTGHSFHMSVPPMIDEIVKSAGIQGHVCVGQQGIGGSKVIQRWDYPDEKTRRNRGS
jgi:hypothetical protein